MLSVRRHRAAELLLSGPARGRALLMDVAVEQTSPTPTTSRIPLLITLAIGGLLLLYDLLRKLPKREFGSDLLGGISIITSVLLGERYAKIMNVMRESESSRRTF